MKEATGELNLTVITLVAVGLVIGFFWFMWPTIRGNITDTWDKTANCTKYDSEGKCIG